jgi:membrane protease YdiL (CAAX protease family)
MKKYISTTRRVVTITTLATFGNIWVVSWIPFDQFPVSVFWVNFLARSFSITLSLVGMRIFIPDALNRFRPGSSLKNVLMGLGVAGVITVPALFQQSYNGVNINQVLESFIFCLLIGADEEIFSRGLLFNALEKDGFWIALFVSSIQFGLSHLGNVVWGGQSLSYTLGQVFSAAAFGILEAALMVSTETLWVPILMHTLIDFPLQFVSSSQFSEIIKGKTDWLGAAIEIFIYLAFATVLLYRAKKIEGKALGRVLKGLGLGK